ncbi:hypothetical protein KCH_36060 [Kitasatospora cheerisanensis KCTC 2395]|uniref:Uncharacterized protein n=1 Tax=Kitasatospora cheerisanensis KCTC 2395 TaxID=1348663 RepID=A0A066YX02_9ACTN|nr:hypothetical protein KCH_36060 [Kitasatospora cheerisanensis KCTC 2395]
MHWSRARVRPSFPEVVRPHAPIAPRPVVAGGRGGGQLVGPVGDAALAGPAGRADVRTGGGGASGAGPGGRGGALPDVRERARRGRAAR